MSYMNSYACVLVCIYKIYTRNPVPTVFYGLNKLLLFGTKIVTLFGRLKNVFVKQKHSGQITECMGHYLNALWKLPGCCFLFGLVLFVLNTRFCCQDFFQTT